MTHYLLVLVHVFSMLSWVGAMYFNLTLLFPMYQSRSAQEYATLMQTQGKRAAPLLYLLIVLVALSGIGLLQTQGLMLMQPLWLAKLACWVAMLICHLYGSYVVWPKVFLALDAERPALFFTYKVSMFLSAALGTLAILLSYTKLLGVL